MPSRLKVAVVGLGNHAKWCHCDPMREMSEEFEIAWVWDVVPEKVKEFAREYGAKGAEKYSQILDDASVEMVSVVTPPVTHEGLAVNALEAGKHVLVEKPLAPTVAACDRIIETARRKKRLLTVFHQRRWYANQRIVEQVVREGKLGKIVLVRLSLPLDGQERRPLGAGEAQSLGVSAKFEERFAVFVGFDMLVHHVDQLSRLVGEQPKRLQARASYRNGEDLPWDWEIHLDYPSGVLGIVEMIHSPLPHPKWVISGTDGSLVMDFANDWGPTKVRYREAGGWVEKEIPQTYELGESFQIVYRKMRDAIRINGPVPVEPKDARGAVKILWKALESSRTGSPQELDI